MSSVPTPQPVAASELHPRIVIICGGISGLAATHRLVELLPQAEFTLFEPSDRLGGVLHTVKRDGYLIEQSADNFLVKPSAGIDLCRNLGIGDDLLTTDETRRRAFVVRDGKLIPIPEGFYLMSPRKLWPLLASPALSITGKLRLLAEPFVPRRKYAAAGAASSEEYDESIASFVQRRLGREVFEQLVQPLVAGIYTADPERLSMAATMPQFLNYERDPGSLLRATLFGDPRADRSGNQFTNDGSNSADAASGARYGLFVAPKLGMTSLVDALACRLARTTIQFKTGVNRIERVNHKWRVITYGMGPIPHDIQDFDALICAAPAYAASAMLSYLDEPLSNELRAIEYAGCAVVSLGFKRDQIRHALNGFGFVVPQSEQRRIIAGSFASLKFSGRAPTGDVLIRVFIGGALQPKLLELSVKELIGVAREELADLLQISGEPMLADVARWPRSMPQYYVGHLARVSRIEQLAAEHPQFALAGNAYRGVGIPQCIASGQAAAERIAARWRS